MGRTDFHPKHWAPKGFANGVAAEGRQVFVAGQVGWNAEQEFASDDFVAQVEQALAQHRRGAGRGRRAARAPRAPDLVRHRQAGVPVARSSEVGQAYRRVIGRHFPGHDAGAGGGAGRGPRQGRDRGDGGRSRSAELLTSLL